MMTHFPHKMTLRPADKALAAVGPVRQPDMRDILWDRPLFKAPALPSPRVALDPLPFTTNRLTRPPAQPQA